MTLKQRQVWAGVSFGVGIVLAAWLVLGTLVLDVPGWLLTVVFWGIAFLFLFITAIRFLKAEPRQEEEQRTKRAHEGLTPEELHALQVLRRGLEMRRQPVRYQR